MNVAIYGGSFDPVHRGHLTVARAAARRFDLSRIYFVPADIQPLKRHQETTSYYHRFAMLSIALGEEKNFIPSLLEAPEVIQATGELVSYSIDSVRRFKAGLKKSDRLFFLIGIDAFLSIAKWRSPVELLRECEFIVSSRPGYSLQHVFDALPDELRPPDSVSRLFKKNAATGDIVHGGAIVHLLSGVEVPISATQVRDAAHAGRSIGRWVPPSVGEYIRKTGLYRGTPDTSIHETEPTRSKTSGSPAKPGLHLVHKGHRSSR